MPLVVTGEPPMHWAIAGAGIGLVTLVLLFFTSHRLGISSGFEDACSLVLRVPYLLRDEVLSGRSWRLPFVVGLGLGGLASAVLAGGWHATWSLPRLDAALSLGHPGKVAWMFAGGLLIGFGTRLAGGCTSGHGIFGIANLERASFRSAATFFFTGIVTTALIYGVLAR